MSLQKQIKKNIQKQNSQTLEQYNAFLSPDWRRHPQEDINILASMARNGITLADMNREIARVRNDTYERTSVSVLKLAYSSVALVLMEDYGFTKEQCFEVLGAMDKRISLAVDNQDVIDDMCSKVGIVFEAQDGLERVRML